MKFRVEDDSSRKLVSEILADTTFYLIPSNFEHQDETWSGRFFKKVSPSLEVSQKTAFRSTHRVQVEVNELFIKPVLAQRIDDRAQIETFTFDRLVWNKPVCLLNFCETLQISLDCDGVPELRLKRIDTVEGEYESFMGSEGSLRLL